jgi:hypothetical protein
MLHSFSTLIATNQQQLAQRLMMSTADAMHQMTMTRCYIRPSSVAAAPAASTASHVLPSTHFLYTTHLPLLHNEWDHLFFKLDNQQEVQIGTCRVLKLDPDQSGCHFLCDT